MDGTTMTLRSFITPLHTRTSRDYLQRVNAHDKAACAEVAGQWGKDYWDGDRRYGYGGYHYDGRWASVAGAMAACYGLGAGSRVLDVGCGKGFLLYELRQQVPGLEIAGLDISSYALEHAKPEVQPHLQQGHASCLPFPDHSFDLVFSIMTLHNLPLDQLFQALAEIERVRARHAFIAVESFRNEREKVNLLYWQLTCRAFLSSEEWLWLGGRLGYGGDWEFLYFE